MIYEILDTSPLSKVFIPFFILVCLIAQATGIDSAAYTLSNISCLDLDHGKEPPVWIRLFWSAAIFLATIALLIVGGMEAVKLSSILTSVPLLALQIIFMLSLMRYLKQDFGAKELLILKKTKK